MSLDVLPQQGSDLPSLKKSWFAQRPKRTEAMPAVSMLGSSLEIRGDKALQELSKLDIEAYQRQVQKERLAKQNRYVRKLPTYLRKTEDDMKLEEKKQYVDSQLGEMRKARQSLESLERNSKFFVLNEDNIKGFPSAPSTRRSTTWYNENDITNAKVLNDIGFRGVRTVNYNRDRYQPRPSQHRYALIGDPFAKGMDFNCAPSTCPPQPKASNDNPAFSQTRQAENVRTPADNVVGTGGTVQVPQNIRHQFGSNEVEQLLSDPVKVNLSMEEGMKAMKSTSRNIKIPKPEFTPNPEDPWMYKELGHWGRANVFPYASTPLTTEVNDNYTWDVYDRRAPQVDKWRRTKDGYCRWREAILVRKKMDELWTDYAARQKTLPANWDRSANRPVDPRPLANEKPAKKTARPKKPAKAKPEAGAVPPNDDLPPVVFETPPVTPPPPPKTLVPAKKVERDEEFWNMYNEG